MTKTTIIITRPVSKQQAALDTFSAAGFDVFSAPCFDTIPNPNIKMDWLTQAAGAEVLVILNSHAIDAVLAKQADFTVGQHTQVIAIGNAVTTHWQKHFDHPVFNASGNSESVIKHIEQLKPKNITTLTAAGGRELIKSYALIKRINFIQLNCYIKKALPLDLMSWQKAITDHKYSVLTANSGELLAHIQNQLTTAMWNQLLEKPLVTGSERITKLATTMGFYDVITANSPSNEDMLKALIGA